MIDEKIIREWIEKANPIVDSAWNLAIDAAINVVTEQRDECEISTPGWYVLNKIITEMNTLKKPETLTQ